MNEVRLLGTVTESPELKYTPKGLAVGTAKLSVTRNYYYDGQSKEDTSVLTVTAFGKAGEAIAKLEPKSVALIFGRLRAESWEDKQSGAARSKLGIIAESCQVLVGGVKMARQAELPGSPAASPKPPPDDNDDVPF